MTEIDNITLSNLPEEEWQKVLGHHYISESPNSVGFSKESTRKRNLLVAKEVLDNSKVTFWLADGTLLGAYRNKDFIPWDNESDLDCFEEDLLPNVESLKEQFLAKGFIVRANANAYNVKINLFCGMSKVSIRGLYLCPSYENNRYRLSRSYQYPKKFYEKFDEIKFKGHVFRTPCPIEDYLVFVYGPGWKTPVRYKKNILGEWRNRGVRMSREERDLVTTLTGQKA